MFKADQQTWMYSISVMCLVLLLPITLYSYFELRPANEVEEPITVREILTPADVEHLKEVITEIHKIERANIDTWMYFITALFALSTLVIAGFAIVLPLMGRRQQDNFRKEMDEIKDEVGVVVDKIRGHEEVAQTVVDKMKTSQDIEEGTGEEETSPQSTVRKQATASIVDLAIDDAHDLQRRGDMQAARAKWQSIANLAAGVDDAIAATAWFSVGYLSQVPLSTEADSLQKAMQAYNESIRLDRRNLNAFNNRGNAKSNLGRHEEAIADCDEAIRLDPTSDGAFASRGKCYIAFDNFESAMKDLDEAIRLNPSNSGAFNNRGDAKLQMGEPEAALRDYDVSIRLSPQEFGTYSNRGVAKDQLGDPEGAIKEFDEAIRLKPDSWATYSNRAEANKRLGKMDDAMSDLNRSIEIEGNYTAFVNRGSLNASMGNDEAANSDLEAMVRELPHDQVYLGRFLKELNSDLKFEKDNDNRTAVCEFFNRCIEEVEKRLHT